MSLFSRKQKNKFSVRIKVVSLSSVPYTNGYFYCKLRQVSNGKFESKTKREQIKNNCIVWNKEFTFDATVPEDLNGRLAEAKLRISVRREAGVGKSEIKLGYIDINLSKFYQPGKPPYEYRHVLTGYEKSNQRNDNSILLITAALELESGSFFIKTSDPIRTHSSESQNSSKVQEVQECSDAGDVYKGGKEQESNGEKMTYVSRNNGHSRTSSGASGYSSSNASLNKSEAILTQHKRGHSWGDRVSMEMSLRESTMDASSELDNEAIVNSLFAQVQAKSMKNLEKNNLSLEKITKSKH